MVDLEHCRGRGCAATRSRRLDRRTGRVLRPVSRSRILDDEHRVHRDDGAASEERLTPGHSWGSALGVYMLRRRPELLSAFVGTVQLLGELYEIDLPALGLAFDVPMFFFHDTLDQQTPIELAEAYCGSHQPM